MQRARRVRDLLSSMLRCAVEGGGVEKAVQKNAGGRERITEGPELKIKDLRQAWYLVRVVSGKHVHKAARAESSLGHCVDIPETRQLRCRLRMEARTWCRQHRDLEVISALCTSTARALLDILYSSTCNARPLSWTGGMGKARVDAVSSAMMRYDQSISSRRASRVVT